MGEIGCPHYRTHFREKSTLILERSEAIAMGFCETCQTVPTYSDLLTNPASRLTPSPLHSNPSPA